MNTRDNNLPAIITAAPPMSAEQVRDHVNAVQAVMQSVMKDKVHYGIIPGTPKPSLWKPGAEVLCMAFHIDPEYEVEDLSTADLYRYRVKCIGRHQHTGIRLGAGLGAASSNEEKYKWREALCDEEFEIALEGRKRIKFKKAYQSSSIEKKKQIRTEPDDIDNTVLKMACKRAQIAMTLNVTAASDIFTQDIEDLPEHLRSEAATDPVLLAKWVAAAVGAATPEDLKKVWDEGKVVLKDANDAVAYQALKKAVEDRGAVLKGTKPALADADFEAALKKAKEAIAKGKKTPADILATFQSKNALTPAQIAAINALGIDPNAIATTEAITAMFEKAEAGSISEAEIAKHLGIEELNAATLTVGQIEKAMAFIADPVGASKK